MLTFASPSFFFQRCTVQHPAAAGAAEGGEPQGPKRNRRRPKKDARAQTHLRHSWHHPCASSTSGMFGRPVLPKMRRRLFRTHRKRIVPPFAARHVLEAGSSDDASSMDAWAMAPHCPLVMFLIAARTPVAMDIRAIRAEVPGIL